MDVIDIIAQCAKIPSYSTEEQRIHPFIEEFVKTNNIGTIEHVHKNNLIITVPSPSQKPDTPPSPVIALTAHLDKIDHFNDPTLDSLPMEVDEKKITGQLDDAAGVGICLFLAHLSKTENFPPLLLLFSEMEEHGSFVNPEEGIVSGLGGLRIAKHLIADGRIPRVILTVDTTPFYRGNPGVSLYSRFWEIAGYNPAPALVEETEKLEQYFLTQFPVIQHRNNTNDYITYGTVFNTQTPVTVPSIALEPAIYPCHQKGEEIFLTDIHKIITILTTFLVQFPL